MNIIIKNVHIISPADSVDTTGNIYIKNGVFSELTRKQQL